MSEWNGKSGVWIPYAPVITASGAALTLGGGSTLVGSYRVTDKTADVQVALDIGSGWAAGTGFFRITLPTGMVPMWAGSGDVYGTCSVWDASAAVAYNGIVCGSTVGTVRLFVNAVSVGLNAPITFVSTDRISVHINAMELT